MSSRSRNAANVVPHGQGAVGGDVLDAVDGQVRLPCEQGGVDLLGEGALAFDLGEIAQPLVARGPDGNDLGDGVGVEGREPALTRST